jgi:hypothetical protein
MVEEIKQWEYRVQTIGSVFGTKDEQSKLPWINGVWKAGKRSTFTRLMEAAKLRSLPSGH